MSQTDVRTFKAGTMQEALEMVRNELGPEAVILQTRELPPPRFFRWGRQAERVEVTAGAGVNVRTPRARLEPSERAAGPVDTAVVSQFGDLLRAGSTASTAVTSPGTGFSAGSSLPPVADRPARPNAPARSSQLSSAGLAGAPVSAPLSEQQASIARQLNSIQQMVTRLTRESASRGEEIPGELFNLYTELIEAEVDEELSRDLVRQLKQSCTPEELGHASAAKTKLRGMVEAEIRCAPPIGATPGKRRVVALIGPTGVGKTTTIAKLAANFRLREGIRMGLVTVDTYRIAAVEQLRTYAEIIDLPMKVVTSPREMRRALDELSGLDLVLIDTAGRSPRDELKIQELKSLLTEAQVDDVHLVLSLVASARSLQATAEKFAPAGATAMILTKLDEAVGMGTLLSVARRVPLPVSYLTTGQDVPDDIEHAQARRISRLVLGEESLFTRSR
ncbi:MAG TPA: flagellar biosynthesis protein FlhF [Planctomycetaceae bacterium]|nr:flagellar biosynthesis protein FlhF [Planctomycetaceae bacterium]